MLGFKVKLKFFFLGLASHIDICLGVSPIGKFFFVSLHVYLGVGIYTVCYSLG